MRERELDPAILLSALRLFPLPSTTSPFPSAVHQHRTPHAPASQPLQIDSATRAEPSQALAQRQREPRRSGYVAAHGPPALVDQARGGTRGRAAVDTVLGPPRWPTRAWSASAVSVCAMKRTVSGRADTLASVLSLAASCHAYKSVDESEGRRRWLGWAAEYTGCGY